MKEKSERKILPEKNLSEKKRRAKKSKLPIAIVLIIAAFMFVKGIMLQPAISENSDKISELQSQIDYEQKRADEIDNLKKNVNSDEYIEKMAREKLGMIRKDEIVFIDVTSEDE